LARKRTQKQFFPAFDLIAEGVANIYFGLGEWSLRLRVPRLYYLILSLYFFVFLWYFLVFLGISLYFLIFLSIS